MLWECVDCDTRYSVDAPRCPHCGEQAYRVVGDDTQTVFRGEEDVAAPAPVGGGEAP